LERQKLETAVRHRALAEVLKRIGARWTALTLRWLRVRF
jgi:DNA-binding HxlR family transcriptional regulator